MTEALPPFANVVEQAPDGVVIVNGSGTIVYANARIAHLFGFNLADLVGQPVEGLIPERFRSQHAGHRGTYAQNPRVRPMGDAQLLFLGRRKDGSEFPVDIQLAPIENGAERWTLVFVRDGTERRAILDDLDRSTRAAQEVARVKGEFLALAAHDLSQPVQTMELAIGLISRLTELPPECAEAIEFASTSLIRMRELLRMLLEISHLESGTIQVREQPVRVADICSDLEQQFGPVARAKAIAFRSIPCPRVIEVDPALLRGMLSNLVANAVRYTPVGEVSVECAASQDGGVDVAVRDTGIGIPAEQRTAIFDDFHRSANAERENHEGFGLGLGIVRRLSKLLGFPVTMNSELGRGSTFAVHIPKEKVSLIPSVAQPE